MSETRRLAAIMAVDVVGFSRLMGEDEAGTARAVREHREAALPIVATSGGRIVKTMGDGLLLEFPSVVAAVECAIAVQKLMLERNGGTLEEKRIVYRIGVNIGDVLIEGDDILGEGVNIAARLEGVCEPGGVLISGAAFEHVRGKVGVEFLDLGDKELKNISRPIRAYRAILGPDGARAAPATQEKSTARPALPDKPSIAVLAFQNMSGDGRYDDAVSHALKAWQANPDFSVALMLYSGALAMAGRMEEALPLARRYMELEPNIRVHTVYQIGMVRELADKIANAGRLLGLPE